MYKEWDTFSSLSEEEILRRYVSERVDLRTLVYVYMAQHPGMTQTSVAEKMGVGQVSLSRALASDKQGIKDDMIPGVLELLRGIDVRNFSRNWLAIQRTLALKNRIDTRCVAIPAILSFISGENGAIFEPRQFSPKEETFVLENTSDGYKWFLIDVSASVYRGIYWLVTQTERSMRSLEDRLTLICYGEQDFRKCTSERMLRDVQSIRPTRYRSVMFVNLEEQRVETEFVLTDPNMTFDMGRFESFSSEDELL